MPENVYQSMRSVDELVSNGHAFGAELGESGGVAHVGVGEEDGVGLAEAVRPIGVGAKVGVEEVELVADVGGGVDEIDGWVFLPPVDDGQTGGVLGGFVVNGLEAVGAEAADVGQSGILHDAEDDGRDLVWR